MTLASCLIGAMVGLERSRAEAYREATRKAIREGRMNPEDGRWCLGDEVDALQVERRKP
jgi:hypothetical protein